MLKLTRIGRQHEYLPQTSRWRYRAKAIWPQRSIKFTLWAPWIKFHCNPFSSYFSLNQTVLLAWLKNNSKLWHCSPRKGNLHMKEKTMTQRERWSANLREKHHLSFSYFLFLNTFLSRCWLSGLYGVVVVTFSSPCFISPRHLSRNFVINIRSPPSITLLLFFPPGFFIRGFYLSHQRSYFNPSL